MGIGYFKNVITFGFIVNQSRYDIETDPERRFIETVVRHLPAGFFKPAIRLRCQKIIDGIFIFFILKYFKIPADLIIFLPVANNNSSVQNCAAYASIKQRKKKHADTVLFFHVY